MSTKPGQTTLPAVANGDLPSPLPLDGCGLDVGTHRAVLAELQALAQADAERCRVRQARAQAALQAFRGAAPTQSVDQPPTKENP